MTIGAFMLGCYLGYYFTSRKEIFTNAFEGLFKWHS
jgi:hypothetical protein